jgi:hypothetical protein
MGQVLRCQLAIRPVITIAIRPTNRPHSAESPGAGVLDSADFVIADRRGRPISC